MGNYATSDELKARFESDEDLAFQTDSEDTGVPDPVVLAEALDDAEGEMDSYLGKRYAIPVDVSTDTRLAARLKSVALDLAVHNVLARGDITSDDKTKSHDDAILWLTDIRDGEGILPAADGVASTTSDEPVAQWGTAGTVVSGTSQRLFTRATQERL